MRALLRETPRQADKKGVQLNQTELVLTQLTKCELDGFLDLALEDPGIEETVFSYGGYSAGSSKKKQDLCVTIDALSG
jgi:hypothetical protein